MAYQASPPVPVKASARPDAVTSLSPMSSRPSASPWRRLIIGRGLGEIFAVRARDDARWCLPRNEQSSTVPRLMAETTRGHRHSHCSVLSFAGIAPATPCDHGRRRHPGRRRRSSPGQSPGQLEDQHGTASIVPASATGLDFGGSAPGPVNRRAPGPDARVTLRTTSPTPHSVDFHAAGSHRTSLSPTDARQEEDLQLRRQRPGVFMYHLRHEAAATHIPNGMHGAIVVEPKQGTRRRFLL